MALQLRSGAATQDKAHHYALGAFDQNESGTSVRRRTHKAPVGSIQATSGDHPRSLELAAVSVWPILLKSSNSADIEKILAPM